jgi:hypothetical protein
MIKNTHKKILIGIFALAAVSVAGYFYYSYSFARLGTGTACTMEARQCPDGSFVGRTGPRCAFAPCGEVVLNSYFYSEARDTEQYGNILCSSKGLVAVPKKVVAEKYTITHALNELLRGEITTKQKADGLSTEFPLTGLSLVGVSVENGTAEILFMDPLHRSSGGSCRVSILRAQVEATVRQFPGINRVIIKPDEAFQP